MVKIKSKRVIVPCGGGSTEHDVESVVVWVRSNVGENEGGIVEIFEVYGLREKVIWFVNGVDYHLSVDLLKGFCGGTLFKEEEE